MRKNPNIQEKKNLWEKNITKMMHPDQQPSSQQTSEHNWLNYDCLVKL